MMTNCHTAAKLLSRTLGIACECHAVPKAEARPVSVRDAVACDAWLEKNRGLHFYRWAWLLMNGEIKIKPSI